MSTHHHDAAWFTQMLLRWYEKHGRDFIWRRADDPYIVLVCEVLLRRSRSTTVATVVDRLLQRWPSTSALAGAEPDAVAAVIRPLGLTSRGGQLVLMAGRLSDLPRFPTTVEELTALPGIGRYAAAASLGLPTVDGTSARVYRRFFGLTDHRPDRTVDDELWAFVETALPDDASVTRRLNWAVLDLAAAVCLPQKPRCRVCPLEDRCRSSPTIMRDA